MYIFNIPRILTPHVYYHSTIIVYQSTYTSPQIHVIITFTKFHQCTYSPNFTNAHIHQISPMHIFTKSHIQLWHIAPNLSAFNVLRHFYMHVVRSLDSEITITKIPYSIPPDYIHNPLRLCSQSPPIMFFTNRLYMTKNALTYTYRLDNANFTIPYDTIHSII